MLTVGRRHPDGGTTPAAAAALGLTPHRPAQPTYRGEAASEWSVGVVLDVCGCSHGEIWQLVGKFGARHCAIRRDDCGKTWKWALGATAHLLGAAPEVRILGPVLLSPARRTNSQFLMGTGIAQAIIPRSYPFSRPCLSQCIT